MRSLLALVICLGVVSASHGQFSTPPSNDDFKLIGPTRIRQAMPLPLSLDEGLAAARTSQRPLFVAKNVSADRLDKCAEEAYSRNGIFAVAGPDDSRVDEGFTEVIIAKMADKKVTTKAVPPLPTPKTAPVPAPITTNSNGWNFDPATGSYWKYTAPVAQPPVMMYDPAPVMMPYYEPSPARQYGFGAGFGGGFGRGFNFSVGGGSYCPPGGT
jgi:hypothetical protein